MYSVHCVHCTSCSIHQYVQWTTYDLCYIIWKIDYQLGFAERERERVMERGRDSERERDRETGDKEREISPPCIIIII